MKAVADTLGVSRSNLIERLKGKSKLRGSFHKVGDAELLPAIRRLVDQRPTYGYRRIAALLNRERRAADKPVVNAKRVHRIMGNHAMLLEKHTAVRKGRTHDGKVMVMRSNLRWCSDGLEFTCWNGEVIRLAFIIDAFDREIIAWTAVANAGISGSDVRDMMLEAVEKRFTATRAPHAIEHLSDNGSRPIGVAEVDGLQSAQPDRNPDGPMEDCHWPQAASALSRQSEDRGPHRRSCSQHND